MLRRRVRRGGLSHRVTRGSQEKKRKGAGEQGGKKKKAKKDANAPKGKQSAYFIWCLLPPFLLPSLPSYLISCLACLPAFFPPFLPPSLPAYLPACLPPRVAWSGVACGCGMPHLAPCALSPLPLASCH